MKHVLHVLINSLMRKCLFGSLFLCLFFVDANAQDVLEPIRFEVPVGSNVIHAGSYKTSGAGHKIELFATQAAVYVYGKAAVWEANLRDEFIVNFCQKTDDPTTFFILTSWNGIGVTYKFTVDAETGEITQPEEVGSFNTEMYSLKKIAGDALYVLGNNQMYVSRDTGVTWDIDTLGFNDAYAWDFSIDSAQYVYAATDKGLFKQHPDSSAWHFVDSLYYDYFGTPYYPNLRSVFVDRNNRILASPWYSPHGVFTSTNGGTTWSYSDQGIEGISVGNFGEDAFGNLYAVGGIGGGSNKLFRSSDGGVTWVQIDTAITNLIKPTAPDQFFNSIGGDTLLFAATASGLFVSTDQGDTWEEANQGIADENPLGIVKLPSGRFAYAGTHGIFTREPADTVWTKRFPVDGYRN